MTQRGLEMDADQLPSRAVLFYRVMAVPVAVLVILTLSFMISREPWRGVGVFRYWALGIAPAIILGGICFLIPLRLESAERWYRARPVFFALLAATLLATACYWAYRFPSGRRQLMAIVLIVICSLEWASLLFRLRKLLLSAAMFALLFSLVVLFEAIDAKARPVIWGASSTMSRTFPRVSPFIGPGGRLNPGLDNWMIRSAAENPHRVWIHTNSKGFRNEAEFKIPLTQSMFSILSLGDSFSNGFGIDQTQFYGSRLQSILRRSFDPSTIVMNAEVSDPCYGLHFLEAHGIAYRPKLIIYNLCGNDAVQSLWGCGPNGVFRLDPAGNLQLREDRNLSHGHVHEYWDEYVYPVQGNVSKENSLTAGYMTNEILQSILQLRLIDRLGDTFITRNQEIVSSQRAGELTASSAMSLEGDGHKRLFDGFPNLGMAYRKELPPKKAALAMLFGLLESMEHKASSIGADFLVVYFPQRHQVQKQDWEMMRQRWNLDLDDFDLDYEAKTIGRFCSKHGISFVDLTGSFKQAAENDSIFLPFDGHPNEIGHEQAARKVAAWIQIAIKTVFSHPIGHRQIVVRSK